MAVTATAIYDLPEEHKDFRATIRQIARERVAPRAAEIDATGEYPWDVRRLLAEQDILGLPVEAEHGGTGTGTLMLQVAVEEITCACASSALILMVQELGTLPITRFGSDDLKERYLPRCATGEWSPAFCLSEPDAGSDAGAMRTSAVRDGDEWVINGSKTYITNGHRADFIVLVAKTDPDAGHDGISLFLVDMDLPGVVREQRLQKLGMHASDTALLSFQDVRVPAEALLGQEGKGFYNIMWELQGERMIGAAGCVAAAQKAFDRTLRYASERQAFGRPIGRFQVIRHKLAEMATDIEAARQLVYATAWRFANGDYPVREISMAKIYAARMACRVTDECLQIHGGAGYMKEYGIERVWRDMRLNRIGAGTDEIMLEVIGRSYGL